YARAAEALKASRGNYRMARSYFVQLRQLASGFLGVIDDETGSRAKIFFPENPKLETAIAVCEESAHKVLVFYDFIWTGEQLAKQLKAAGIGHAQIAGATK